MKTKLVTVDETKAAIYESPGFAKKGLSTYKFDAVALCQFGCTYCSSNLGNYLRMYQSRFADLTEQQTGERTFPAADPNLMFVYRDVVQRLERDLDKRPKSFGRGKVLMFSMLTDGFSPWLVQHGYTRALLDLLIHRTEFRVRVLTKNAVVGHSEWIEYFLRHSDRFTVGLSCGSTDDAWARRIEVNTSSPSARTRSLRALQDAGVPTYGMLCPIFPDMLGAEKLEELADLIRPAKCEDVWAEPFNDRANWRRVRAGYEPGSDGYRWFTEAFEGGDATWSQYATTLYTRLRDKAEREGWIEKLHYLLYEDRIVQKDAASYEGMAGLLLQSKPGDNGRSKNPHIAAVQP